MPVVQRGDLNDNENHFPYSLTFRILDPSQGPIPQFECISYQCQWVFSLISLICYTDGPVLYLCYSVMAATPLVYEVLPLVQRQESCTMPLAGFSHPRSQKELRIGGRSQWHPPYPADHPGPGIPPAGFSNLPRKVLVQIGGTLSQTRQRSGQ